MRRTYEKALEEKAVLAADGGVGHGIDERLCPAPGAAARSDNAVHHRAGPLDLGRMLAADVRRRG